MIVIEEVARACASSSLIPAVNKLGSLPVQISGSEELKKTYLTKLAAGEGGFSYCLSEPDAGSDAGGMKTRAVRDGDGWVLNGVKRWITNAGQSEYYTVMAVTDRRRRPAAASRVRRGEVRRGRLVRCPGEEARHQGLADPRGLPRQRADPRRPDDRRGGHRFRHRDEDPRPHPHHDRRAGRRHRPGALDYALAYAQERQQFGKPIADFRACSSCSPTWASRSRRPAS